MKILLVSGGPSVTAQVTTALLGEDFRYFEVRTPQAALKVLEDDPSYDLILADCDTHPTGGFFLAREVRLRSADGQPMPPLVLMIARAQDEYLARWSEADAWVLKPVDPFDLAETIESLVERRPVPALPGVQTLSDDRSLAPPPRRPPLSTGADFRVWGGRDEPVAADDEAEQREQLTPGSGAPDATPGDNGTAGAAPERR